MNKISDIHSIGTEFGQKIGNFLRRMRMNKISVLSQYQNIGISKYQQHCFKIRKTSITFRYRYEILHEIGNLLESELTVYRPFLVSEYRNQQKSVTFLYCNRGNIGHFSVSLLKSVRNRKLSGIETNNRVYLKFLNIGIKIGNFLNRNRKISTIFQYLY